MKNMFKSAVGVMLAVIMVFGGAPAGALAGLDFNWPEWLKSPFSFKASAEGDVWDGTCEVTVYNNVESIAVASMPSKI